MTARNKKWSAPLKWHGGKTYLAARVIALIPEHVHYVEPYFGGGAVFFRKPEDLIEGHSEVINDIYGELMTFWGVLSSEDQFPEFQRRALLTPFSKPLWEQAAPDEARDLISRALAFFVRYRQSRQGLGRDFATMSRTRTRRGMNEQASSWLSAVEGLQDAHERLHRAVIYCEDGCDVIEREDDKDTFFYCDPPYVTGTRAATNAYAFEMSDDDHRRLLTTLGQIRGRFLLSGYRSELYDAAARKYGWGREEFCIDNKASSAKTKQKKIECLWRNF